MHVGCAAIDLMDQSGEHQAVRIGAGGIDGVWRLVRVAVEA